MALLSGGQEIAQSDSAGAPPEPADAGESLLDLLSAPALFRYDSGDSTPVTGDENSLAALHSIQKFGETGSSLGCLHLAHILTS